MKNSHAFCLVGVFLINTISKSLSQSVDTTINLNLLRGPISPASNLLGISPNDIQRPTDVPGFMVSLQNATQNFISLPSNFAIDIAPYWVSGNKGREVSFKDYNSNKDSFRQTFTFSTAVNYLKTKQNTDSTVQTGFGFRFSILRGKFDSTDVQKLADNLRRKRRLIDNRFDALTLSNSNYLKLDTLLNDLDTQLDSVTTSLQAKLKPSFADSLLLRRLESDFITVETQLIKLRTEIDTEATRQVDAELSKAKQQIENKPFQRYGCKLDMAGGISWDFPELKFSNAGVAKIGLWLTGGIDKKNGNSFLGILRYLYNPDRVFADDTGKLKGKTNISTLDFGARYNRQGSNSPFSFGTELIYRSVVTKKTLPSSWRWTANFSYEVSKNTVLTLAFGRDFDKTFKKDGNVIAFLNFIKGFGSTRRMPVAP